MAIAAYIVPMEQLNARLSSKALSVAPDPKRKISGFADSTILFF
jgi:hypothetical protein